MPIVCTRCHSPYPSTGLPYSCSSCGGQFDYASPWVFDPGAVDSSQPGIFRYRHTFGLPDDADAVSLGEGNTPLIWANAFGREVAFKCEFINPTGSFKDRGSALIATWLKRRAVAEAVEDSSGNAGASIAAYAARSGIRISIFVPAAATGPKRLHIAACGADLVPVPGLRPDAAAAARRRAAEAGVAYASHAALPFNLPGYATAAYEIFAQLGGRMPGAVVLPAGQGGLLLGLGRGFRELRIAISQHTKKTTNTHPKEPKMIGVQARLCSPLWAAFTDRPGEADCAAGQSTLAEGVCVPDPLRAGEVLAAVAASRGALVAVDEAAILPGREALARLGFYVEPTSAIVWNALAQALDVLPDPVVVILTGSGYKFASPGQDASRTSRAACPAQGG